MLLFLATRIYGQEVSVALYYHRPLEQVIFTPLDSDYSVHTGDTATTTVAAGSTVYLSAVDSLVVLYLPGGKTIRNHRMLLQPAGRKGRGTFRLKPVTPTLDEHHYPGALILKAIGTILLPVNKLDRETYVAAVTEAEGGGLAPAAFVQAQAILVRTFLATAAAKHAEEGFDLCDEVHCQAYHGIGDWYERIYEISHTTEGKILTNEQGTPLHIAYHSNSGGKTADARDVWKKPVPYLISRDDPYSLKGKHAHWKRTFSLEQWRSTLAGAGYQQAVRLQAGAFNFQNADRQAFYPVGKSKVPAGLIRELLELPSAWFTVAVQGDKVILKGRGYGHGLGLSQEGAMEMARRGFTAREILEFYFSANGIQVTVPGN